ncbi:hypothetical protein [Xanthomonas vasicola]|nr:hypothetical protein [Xanthomonas vasicola]RNK45355.1 hypothetical protein C9401_10040 [Xanthomonas vasicola pv. vasculorum]RNK53876.1 hypothetical protein C9393_14770 [Xanthomonas vasicola pv. vasculorum]RNK66472.1 hypothetical protein C9394_12305 [Xanthomonas vasicola pv. vasculorum]RNK70543.1 hypothetical protein C9399_00345 [Xanthomonas vasicola pv. vasculorum]RNK93240.1 hypothetical protein C9408_04400 [Xanthomonas vasicola pv. vasculorum]
MKKILSVALFAALAVLAGCNGDRTAAPAGTSTASGTIPGDAVIPVFEKLGLPDRCKQVASFDQVCADQIDKAYGSGAGDDARLKLKTCRAYGNCGDKRGAPAKSTVPPAKTSF